MLHQRLMGPLCNLCEFKVTNIRLVKFNKANLSYKDYWGTNQCLKKERESAEEDLRVKELWRMSLFIISKQGIISQGLQQGGL